MNLDTAYIEPFIYDWVEHLQETMKEREQEIISEKLDLIMPYGALTTHTMKAAMCIATHLEVEPNVKYMAIELFDKFMNKSFWEAYNGRNNQSNEWFEVHSKRTCTHTKLYLVSCFQLACKMNSHPNSLGITQILQLLRVIDQNYECTRDTVSSMEIEIFKKVGFKMPLYTPVYCIEVLLAATGLGETPRTFDISMQLLDLAYMEHEKLYHHFQLYFVRKNSQMSEEEKELELRILKSNSLFLSAAIVLCATLYFISSDTSIITEKIIAANLAELADAAANEITVMANTLFQIVQYSK
ncbi:cyclin n-terminal domain-containing protein 1-like isoform x2 protein [Lasius niger]|uniref:Cyclin n-terminal domain-containing protein 1-like isoform x2 protein n=1 Tax=Lasius niger TaxID=67767 RepID=A0A0J7KHL0_LASNI|nr:cyclin n-terminal domain-containing protein 1-like isoform x2 protein [Lasius niger]